MNKNIPIGPFRFDEKIIALIRESLTENQTLSDFVRDACLRRLMAIGKIHHHAGDPRLCLCNSPPHKETK